MKCVKTAKLIALENFPLCSIGMSCASLSDYINNVYLYPEALFKYSKHITKQGGILLI